MATTYTLIASTVLSVNTATVSFTAIPQTYKDLIVLISARGTANTYDYLATQFNGNNTSIYNGTYLYSSGAGGPSVSSGNINVAYDNGNIVPRIPAVGINTASFSNSKIYIPNYTSNQIKAYATESLALQNSTSTNIGITSNYWNSTSAITSIMFKPYDVGSFTTNSTFHLYGIG